MAVRIGAAVAAIGAAAALSVSSVGAGFTNWPGYLFDNTHPSYSRASTAVTTANVGGLHVIWHWSATRGAAGTNTRLFATPAVYNGRIYIGANTGDLYALDEATGHVIWKRFLGWVSKKTCGARGLISTATVAPDPSSGTATVYVAGADGYLYALNAATGAVVWRSVVGIPSSSVNDWYNWASPAVANGHVYMGMSSQCDNPFIRGGLKMYDQHTGSLLATYYSEPPGVGGGGVWSSPVVETTGTRAFITTATPCPKVGVTNQFSCAIVALNKSSLAQLGAWFPKWPERAGGDSDFGGSPVLFTATLNGASTQMVAACNKNGILYGWRRADVSAGPVWRFQVGQSTPHGQLSCLAAPVWDGRHLFQAGNPTTIGGKSYQGSMRELNPATGTPIWQVGLPAIVLGSPTMNGNGILAASTYDTSGAPNGTYFLSSTTGSILKTIPTPGNSETFAQPVFADSYVFVASVNAGMTAYAP